MYVSTFGTKEGHAIKKDKLDGLAGANQGESSQFQCGVCLDLKKLQIFHHIETLNIANDLCMEY